MWFGLKGRKQQQQTGRDTRAFADVRTRVTRIERPVRARGMEVIEDYSASKRRSSTGLRPLVSTALANTTDVERTKSAKKPDDDSWTSVDHQEFDHAVRTIGVMQCLPHALTPFYCMYLYA